MDLRPPPARRLLSSSIASYLDPGTGSGEAFLGGLRFEGCCAALGEEGGVEEGLGGVRGVEGGCLGRGLEGGWGRGEGYLRGVVVVLVLVVLGGWSSRREGRGMV